MPDAYREHAEFAYLDGHTMGELIDAELTSTEAALRHAGPSVVVFRRECIQSLRRGVLKEHDREAREHAACSSCTPEVTR